MTLSVVISTYNRSCHLEAVLEALRYQNHAGFEVIVVNGPSTDETSSILERYKGFVRIKECHETNLSRSRNIGVKAAKGNIIAFLDDDAIPEQSWIERIIAAFEQDHSLDCLGGAVIFNNGVDFQSRFIIADRFGDAKLEDALKSPQGCFCYPGARRFLAPMGCNVAMRRSAIVSVGGFDEQYDYFLDETDLALRMMDAGYRIRFDMKVIVLHRFAPSDIRKDTWPLDWFKIVKNKYYFGIVSSDVPDRQHAIEQQVGAYIERIAAEALRRQKTGLLSREDARRCVETAQKGLAQGRLDAASRPRSRIRVPAFFDDDSTFRAYPIYFENKGAPAICLLTKGYPPHSTDGIPRYTKFLAEGLARRGWTVHVLSLEAPPHRVDFENGVWVHRITAQAVSVSSPPKDLPEHIWREVLAYRQEVERIHTEIHPVKLVQGAIWDLAPLATLGDHRFITVAFICTTFAIKRSLEPAWYLNNRILVDAMIKFEGEMLRRADALNFDSKSLLDLCEKLYGELDNLDRAKIIHLGTPDPGIPDETYREDGLILFVGRLEDRKGIDVLLGAIPDILVRHPGCKVVLAGKKDIEGPDGRTYEAAFLARHKDEPWLPRVSFLGYVSDSELWDLYKRCSIFVAPSRYESFGQMAIEAMAVGKPIVTSAAGGLVEVMGDPPAGILAAPGSVDEVRDALDLLLKDQDLRHKLSMAARSRYESEFSAEAMTGATSNFFHSLIQSSIALR